MTNQDTTPATPESSQKAILDAYKQAKDAKDHRHIELETVFTDLITDRIYKKMQAFPDFKRGAWLSSGQDLVLAFVPTEELPETLPSKVLEAIKNYDLDKDCVIVLAQPAPCEVRGADGKPEPLSASALLVTKPGNGLRFTVIEAG